MFGTAIGTKATDTDIADKILWMYDDNSEHAHRIELQATAMGGTTNDTPSGKGFVVQNSATHKVVNNTSSTA
jgi:hypothetical protein